MFFKYVFGFEEENYGVLLFAGLILWMAFAESASRGMRILEVKRYLIEFTRVKKIDLYASLVGSILFGVMFNMTAYLVICLIMGITLSLKVLFIPLILINLILVCLGTAMILSVVHIFLKDINHAWDLIALLGFWSSGVFARGEVFIEAFPPIKYLHPFIGMIMNFRNVTMFNVYPDFELMGIGLIWGVVLFGIGYYLMNRYSSLVLEKI